MLRPTDAERIGIDRDLVLERRAALAATPDLDKKLAHVYGRRDERGDRPRDVEERLYEGFTSNTDRGRCESLQRELRARAAWPDIAFADSRLRELGDRLRARLRPESLDSSQRAAWKRHIVDRLTQEHPRTPDRRRSIRAMWKTRLCDSDGDGDRGILGALQAYGQELERRAQA